MTKKNFHIIIPIVTIVCIFFSYTISWANTITYKDIKSTKQFLVTLTRPEGNDTTFSNFYIISGITNQKDINFKILIYNKHLEQYEPIKIYDECKKDFDDYWEIGELGFFVKEIELPKKGSNLLRFIAYKKHDIDLKENFQVNNFKVTVLDESIRESIKNNIFRITDIFSEFFK